MKTKQLTIARLILITGAVAVVMVTVVKPICAFSWRSTPFDLLVVFDALLALGLFTVGLPFLLMLGVAFARQWEFAGQKGDRNG